MLDCKLRFWEFMNTVVSPPLSCPCKISAVFRGVFFLVGGGGCRLSHFTKGGTETKL